MRDTAGALAAGEPVTGGPTLADFIPDAERVLAKVREWLGLHTSPAALEVPLLTADHAVLAAVERDLLRIEVLETSLAKALDLMRPDTARLGYQRERIRKELVRLAAELERLTGAIAAGGELAALLAALQARERRRQALHAELVGLEHVTAGAGRFDLAGTLTALREQLTDWQGMLRQEGPQARHALSALLAGRLTFTPRGEGQGRYYEFAGPGTLRKVIAGLAFPMELVPPAGSVRSATATIHGRLQIRAA